jgi:formylglycine-generating enzyme required for sulfatase activity
MICSLSTPEMVIIPAGSFLMGCDQGQENERPVHRVWLDGFALGKFSTTNREYKICVDDKAVAPPPFWSEPMFSHPDQPVVGVTWHEATAYCRWLSERVGQAVRLPTEAEWERAARGKREGALYPWGDEPPWERPFSGFDLESGGPARVGAGEANDFGLYAMSEGVHEWCSDYYAYDYYRHSPEKNPPGPSSGQRRSSRGGSWRHRIKFSRCAGRSSLPPNFKYADYGFRIAMTV